MNGHPLKFFDTIICRRDFDVVANAKKILHTYLYRCKSGFCLIMPAVFVIFCDMENAADLIKRLSPLMDENSEVFRELSTFFGSDAKVVVHQGDLAKFLGRKRLYRVIRLQGDSYKDCVYQLVDDYPESMEALGMLRYYKAPTGKIQWADIENAEIAIGKELTVNAYGWEPDAWTAFEGTESQGARHEMVAILAFDFGD